MITEDEVLEDIRASLEVLNKPLREDGWRSTQEIVGDNEEVSVNAIITHLKRLEKEGVLECKKWKTNNYWRKKP